MHIMCLPKYLLVPLAMLLWSSLCSCSKDERLGNYVDEASTYDTNQAYPALFGFKEGEDSELQRGAPGLIQYRPEIYGSEELDQADSPEPPPGAVNVEDFGAKGDGVTDDTDAFKEAWNEACTTIGSVLVVPAKKNFLLKPITFSGPCKSDLTVQIYGTIEASDNQTDYEDDRQHWLVFDRVDDLTVEGGGTFDGKGETWWNSSCKINKKLKCVHAPTALTFHRCMNLRVSNIIIRDAQQMHLIFSKCVNVQAIDLLVTAPGKSPNTDGIHVTDTQNIHIMSSVIGTGDDCISIVDGSKKVQATDITCGPGHGISIGSLGAKGAEDHVSDVKVDKAKLVGTTNGVRIKTWQGGAGSATNIIFQNIVMDNVTNPIIIDQNYCDKDGPCKEKDKAVQIKNVVYRNIRGTSASKVAMKFDCSKKHPCTEILLQDIKLEREGDADEGESEVKALCKNVKWSTVGTVIPSCP